MSVEVKTTAATGTLSIGNNIAHHKRRKSPLKSIPRTLSEYDDVGVLLVTIEVGTFLYIWPTLCLPYLLPCGNAGRGRPSARSDPAGHWWMGQTVGLFVLPERSLVGVAVKPGPLSGRNSLAR